MVSLLVIVIVIPLVLRRHAGRVEAGGGEVPDQVHRIRRAQMAAFLALPVLEIVMLAEGYGEGRVLAAHYGSRPLAGHAGIAITIGALAYLAVFVAGSILCYLATYPATSRLRGLPSRPGRAGRRQARVMFAVLAPQLVWFPLWIAAHMLHLAPGLALPIWIAYLVAVIVLAPALMRAALPTKPVDGVLRRRLLGFAAEHKVGVADIRCLDTGPERTANAMVMGLIPKMRYILVTDRLLSDLAPDELEAVLAHELGHAKKHHLLIKLGAMLVAWLPPAGAVAALAASGGHHSAAVTVAVTVLITILVLASLLLIQGAVGVRLERKADDYASATVGADALRRGLEKLAAANAAKRRTGRVWNLLNQHPGLEQRIERLRKVSAQPQPAR